MTPNLGALIVYYEKCYNNIVQQGTLATSCIMFIIVQIIVRQDFPIPSLLFLTNPKIPMGVPPIDIDLP